MSGGGGGGGSQQVIQNSDPWSGAQPHLRGVMSLGQGFMTTGQGQRYYPESTVTPFSNATENGLAQMEGRALRGSPLTSSAQNFGMGLLNDRFQDTNYGQTYSRLMDPANQNNQTQGLLDRISGDVTNNVNSQFSASGRYGSGKHSEALSRGITEGIAPVLFNQANTDRAMQLGAAQAANNAQSDLYGRQIQGAAIAPQLAAMDYTDPAQLMAVGAAREGKSAEHVQDALTRYQYNQLAPWDRLKDYASIIQGTAGLGGTSTQSTMTPSQGGGLSGALGGAAGGAMAGSAFGPWGTAIGGGVGLLSGIF